MYSIVTIDRLTDCSFGRLAVFMLETLKLSKTLKSSRDDLNDKYKNGKTRQMHLTSDDFNVFF